MCLILSIVLLFFFFKQKTAYDMRISDWSSDVCSSDLSADDVGELSGAPDRLVRACLDDGTGDAARQALFAEIVNDPGKVVFGQGADHLLGGRPIVSHAHVQRAVGPEREAAGRVVQSSEEHTSELQ